MNKKHNVIANMQGVIASMAKQSLACIAVASLAFGLSACGDDSSSASSNEPEVSLTGVFFASDYTTGELRWIDKEGKVSEKKLSFYQDSRVAVNGADLFVMEGLSKDNIVLVDPEKLETDGEKAVVWQVSLDDDTNPIDMAFDGDKAWVALQNADSLIQISTKDGKILKSIKTGTFSNGEEKSPYVADIALDDGKLYALRGICPLRCHVDVSEWPSCHLRCLYRRIAGYDSVADP